jgi:hypothetical protein
MDRTLSEINKWRSKYLIKLETQTKALAENIIGNSETARRLKRYSVLTPAK